MRLLLLTIFLFSNLSAESGILEIKWPKPNPKYQKPIIPYPHVLINGIANTKLPIYIPNSYAYDKNMIVVANENFYTISFILDGAIFMVSGDKTYQESISKSDSKAQAIMKRTSLEFVQAEGMMTTDFNRHGVNYSLLIECDKPKTDKRCTQDNFLKDIYKRLIMVGGKA